MRRSRIVITAVLLLPVLGGAFFLERRAPGDGAVLLDEVLQLVGERYVDTIPPSDVYEKAARGLVRELNDPYSELLAPSDLKQFNSRTGGRYGGVGMQIESQQGQVTVSTVFPNTPAEAAGIIQGDHIIQVDTTNTRGMSLQQVSDLLTGTPGTKVSAKFARPGVATPIGVTFTRAVIHVPAVPYAIMLDGKVGYIPLTTFNENAAEEFRNAVTRMMREGAKGVVIDLRSDPGGILDQSLAVANMFLMPGQEIAAIRGRDGVDSAFKARGTPLTATLPLVILTDPGTASASEIVAGALQDHDRAVVVGQTSFGKGLVQSVYPIDGGYALKLTTAKWYTPSGRSIQRPRKFVNGQFVEDSTDSASASKTGRPRYKSDAGRTVYGGGGITPDVVVDDDTLTTAEQQFSKAIAQKNQEFFTAYWDYSLELSKRAPQNLHVQQAWLDEFYSRLQSKGIVVDRKLYDSANRYVGRLLEQRVARFAAGDSTAKRMDLPYDSPLRKAISLIERGSSQKDLLALASAEPPAERSPARTPPRLH